MADSSTNSGTVFISYSHQDAAYLARLQQHLAPHVRSGAIPLWDDTHIKPGDDWKRGIEQALGTARIALLLVSVSFLASEFVAKEELPKLLAAAEERGTRILPIILRPCNFRRTNLSRFQSINDPAKPLSGLRRHEQDLVWERVVEIVLDVLEAISAPAITSALTKNEVEQSQEYPIHQNHVDENPQEDQDKQQGAVTTKEQLQEKALFYQKNRQYEKALDAYDRVLELDPNEAVAAFGRGNMLWSLKRYEEARSAYDRALQLTPKNAIGYTHQAHAFWSLKRYEEALAAYEMALQFNPHDASAHNGRGNALRVLKRYEEALEAYRRAVEIVPSYAYAYNNMGLTFRELKQYKEALAAFEQAIQSNPTYALAYNNAGLLLTALGRDVEAEQVFQKARELGFRK